MSFNIYIFRVKIPSNPDVLSILDATKNPEILLTIAEKTPFGMNSRDGYGHASFDRYYSNLTCKDIFSGRINIADNWEHNSLIDNNDGTHTWLCSHATSGGCVDNFDIFCSWLDDCGAQPINKMNILALRLRQHTSHESVAYFSGEGIENVFQLYDMDAAVEDDLDLHCEELIDDMFRGGYLECH